jgi:hypothetical protein
VNNESMTPFETIESAQEYIALLIQAVSESQEAIAADIRAQAPTESPRRLEALNLIVYNLDKLSVHVNRSRRILNDLRTLRRLLHEERTEIAA